MIATKMTVEFTKISIMALLFIYNIGDVEVALLHATMSKQPTEIGYGGDC